MTEEVTTFIYRIRSKKTGLFSLGGTTPSFGKKGKIWTSRGYISSHFTNLDSHGIERYRHESVEILEYALSETHVSTTPVEGWLEAVETRKKEREAAYQVRVENYQKEQRRRQFEKLQQEFGTGVQK